MSTGYNHPLAGFPVDTSRDDERVAQVRAERAAEKKRAAERQQFATGDTRWSVLAALQR